MIQSKRKKESLFIQLHPLIIIWYFAVLLLITMLCMHPMILILSLVCAVIYSLYLMGTSQVKYCLKLLLIPAFVCIINPLVNHQGQTILIYLNDNPITKESLLFGLGSGLMIYDVLLWFHIFNAVVSEDMLICVMSHVFPRGALILTMAFRFVPMYQSHYHTMQQSLKGIGQSAVTGKPLDRLMNLATGISAMITWCLENAIETADSMKARGFQIKKRTYYKNIRFTQLDLVYLILQMVLTVGIVIGVVCSSFQFTYFPSVMVKLITKDNLGYMILFAVFGLWPFLADIREGILWRIWKSRI